ncbi:Abi family protein [Mesorhizobium sp. WSM4904]|uniref:Abi family protein n=1 Tax=Mesorhizobium sp. WSM4904 TaxID=3038545 RepID=UPI002418AB9A|nr:Abi family protein [Mesorhizobium sp. WSM4904]WFP61436.1 Abi family protein [Mesorhizobium sp. WSM4904]
MDTKDYTYIGIEDTLSADRFGTYLGWAGGDRNRAVELYTLNAVLSESLYIPLHMLEVALRNRIHQTMSKVHGEAWFDMPEHQLNAVQIDMLEKARIDLREKGKDETPGRIVASLTFGYWTALLGKEYENLWQITLKDIARREDGKGLRRKDITKSLGAIRTLRNRLAHHETVLHWDLPKHYGNIIQLITWLSPVAAEWCISCSRFDALYPKEGIPLILVKAG